MMFSVPALAWGGASRSVRWWLPALPVVAVAIAAVIKIATFDEADPLVGEETPILEGFDVFFFIVLALWMGTALAAGWALRLWRRDQRAWAAGLVLATAAPWVYVFVL